MNLDELLLAPPLPGAACHGRWQLFDPPYLGEPDPEVQYRRSAALRACCCCPALDECRRRAPEFARDDAAGGFVIAGTVIPSRRRTMTPTPADHLEPAGRAVALVQLAERGDTLGFGTLLGQETEETVGALVYGLVCLVRASLELAGVHGDDRIGLLNGLAVDVAKDIDGG